MQPADRALSAFVRMCDYRLAVAISSEYLMRTEADADTAGLAPMVEDGQRHSLALRNCLRGLFL